MKISASRIKGFLSRPDPACVCVLVYGIDRGLVSERANLLAGRGDDQNHPNEISLSAADLIKDPARLADEADALTFFSTARRIIRIQGATDGITSLIKAYLGGTPGAALVLLESGPLAPRSSLRKLFESAKNAAAIACYGDDGAALAGIITETLARFGLKAHPDAAAYLRANLGSDRMASRRELEKLALYVGDSETATVTLADAMAAVGDSGAASLDDVIYAAFSGERVVLDRALERAFADGTQPIGVLRAAARHLQRLQLGAALIDGGQAPGAATAAMRPPIIFLRKRAFESQLRRWPLGRTTGALGVLIEAERLCKTSGPPPEAVCGRALLRIAQAAGRK